MYKRIYDSDEIMVDYYHDGKPMIRVTQFQDNHFRDEHFVEIPTTEVELKDKVSKLESKLDECLKHGLKQADELLRLRKENERLRAEVNGECPRKCHCKHGTDDGIGCDGAPEPDGSCFVWGG